MSFKRSAQYRARNVTFIQYQRCIQNAARLIAHHHCLHGFRKTPRSRSHFNRSISFFLHRLVFFFFCAAGLHFAHMVSSSWARSTKTIAISIDLSGAKRPPNVLRTWRHVHFNHWISYFLCATGLLRLPFLVLDCYFINIITRSASSRPISSFGAQTLHRSVAPSFARRRQRWLIKTLTKRSAQVYFQHGSWSCTCKFSRRLFSHICDRPHDAHWASPKRKYVGK